MTKARDIGLRARVKLATFAADITCTTAVIAIAGAITVVAAAVLVVGFTSTISGIPAVRRAITRIWIWLRLRLWIWTRTASLVAIVISSGLSFHYRVSVRIQQSPCDFAIVVSTTNGNDVTTGFMKTNVHYFKIITHRDTRLKYSVVTGSNLHCSTIPSISKAVNKMQVILVITVTPTATITTVTPM